MAIPLNIRYYGKEQPLPEKVPLRAGPLSLLFEAGCLRYIRLGDAEILRRIYVAIRDRNWGTAPDELSNVEIESHADSFRIRFDVANRLYDVDFAWQGQISGEADGTIHFSMDGEARSDFQRARIGFCVLPPMTCAGHKARIVHVDGTGDTTAFPETIAPQLVIDGMIKPVSPFDEMQSLSYEITPDVWATVEFEGDIFEMEDQRNWTDASYKIYSTPLRLPFPVEIRKGDRVQQSITLRLEGEYPEPEQSDASVPQISIGDVAEYALPALGLGMGKKPRQSLTAQEIERLKMLQLAHLRVDLDLSSQTYLHRFQQACGEAIALGVALEVALFVDEQATDQLDALLGVLRDSHPRIARWIVFNGDGTPPPAKTVNGVREVLAAYAANIPVGSGTNGFFTELNKVRPDTSGMDFVAYSLNPQVHAFDNLSLMETPAAQAVTVTSAATITDGKPVVVSPVTLRPRGNPRDTGSGQKLAPGQLPPQVDVRQMSLFGAAWTVASIKYLAQANTASITYYETTGWRGVMETEYGSPLPEAFPSTAGAVFPMYHVLADVGEFAGGQAITTTSSQPLSVDALAVRSGDDTRVLVANLSAEPQSVNIRGLPDQVTVVSLDENSFEDAGKTPEQFRGQPGHDVETNSGSLAWTLLPYAVLRIDSL